MMYIITFEAHTATGEVVAVMTFEIVTNPLLDLTGKKLAFERMCVEYARLTGVKCSFAKIIEVRKDDER